MVFSESDEFKKEFKKLSKKYPSLKDDLKVVKKAITAEPAGNNTKHWNVFAHDSAENYVLKMRMMCRSVTGSQFRLIYYFDGKNVEVLFIEIYYKGNKETEDAKRIKDFVNTLKQEKKWIVSE